MIAVLRLIKSIESVVPIPVLVGLGVLVLVLVGPSWWDSLREREIKGLVRRIARTEAVPDLTAKAFRLAARKPGRLALIASEASRRALPALRDEAWAALAAVDPDRVARERAALAPPAPAPDRHPLAAAAAIEGLLAAGATEAAATRLAAARARFPEDPDLAALERRVG